MENSLEVEDIMLVDDSSSTGGVAWAGETLSDLIRDIGVEEISLKDLNKILVELGIEEITLGEVIVKNIIAK